MLDKCKNCGAEIEYSATIQSLKCPYCDTVNEIKKPEDDLPNSVDLIIPLASSVDELEKQVYGYMAGGSYTPDDMLEAATFVKRECFYVPAYVFSVDYEATWTASFGFDRKEPYTAYRTVTSNGRSYQEAYTAYRTVTDWRPANGVDSGIFTVSIYAGEALNESNLSPSDIVPLVIENGKATAFNDSFMTGFAAENFVVSESKSFDSLDGEINANIDRRVKSHAQGDHQQDWHWNARMSHSSNTIYVPLAHAVFDYQGTEYHYWTDGVTGASVRADQLPVDHGRKKLINKGFIPVGLAGIGAVASSTIWSFSWASLAVVAALAAYGAIRRNAILGYSKNIRNALLVQMQASSTSIKDLSAEDQEKFSKAFQRPERPFFAKTHNDKALIPSLSSAAFLMALMPSYFASPSNLYRSSQIAVQEQIDREASPVIQTSLPNPVVEQKVVQEEQLKIQSSDTVSSEPATPNSSATAESQISPAQPPATQHSSSSEVVSNGRVAELLNFAANGQWQSIDSLASEIQQQATPIARGDRKLGRSLNQEGVTLLQQSNAVAAIDAFKNGLDADPSDIEIKNNLAYALILNSDLVSAEKLLNEVLLRAPERSSAWANLSELYARSGAGQVNASQSSLRLAVHFSQNRQRTFDYLNRSTQTHAVQLYRDVAAKVVKEFEYIPGKVADSSSQNKTTPSNPSASAQLPQENKVVVSMLANAQGAISNKRYQEAITTAKNVLAIDPGNSSARRLMENAEELQRRDLRNVEIR